MAHPHSTGFFLSRRDRPVTPESDVWRRRIPLSRAPGSGGSSGPQAPAIRYGDYFEAVERFIAAGRFEALRAALRQVTGSPVDPERIGGVSVFLEKHGAFYHPSRVRVRALGRPLDFVVNVAVSRPGREAIGTEYGHLDRLRREFGRRYTPAVYALGRVDLPQRGRLSMFLGEWLRGYHEFHAPAPGAPSSGDGADRLVVWDTGRGPLMLTPGQSRAVFRQAAAILTYYYNPFTFEQVFSWHHAAGDFVVKRTAGDTVDVRLITVRRYAPLFSGVTATPETVLEGMLLFLLHLSIRNRLDRAEGVGDLVWWGASAVPATLEGFLDGLAMKVDEGLVPATLPDAFRRYLGAHTESELHDTAAAVVARYARQSPEVPLVRRRLRAHVAGLRHAVGRLLPAE